jgi:hypothetical protein
MASLVQAAAAPTLTMPQTANIDRIAAVAIIQLIGCVIKA